MRQATIWLALGVLTLAAVYAKAQTDEATTNEPDPIIGIWRWFGDTLVTIEEGGVFKASKNARGGTWKYVPSKTLERKYELHWDGGLFVDKLTMSKHGRTLKGKNQKGLEISAERIEQ